MHRLLGGKTKNRLPVYSTTARPDLAKELGFIGIASFLAYFWWLFWCVLILFFN
jgi:hypothetical protein